MNEKFTLKLDAITIIPELRDLLPQPTAEERLLIARAVADENQKIQPLTIWKHEDQIVLIDGHTRYAAMKDAGLTEANVDLRKFDDINAAKEWMIKMQLGRRNLTEAQRAVVAAKLVTTVNGGDRKSDQCLNSGTDFSQTKAADLLNVSRNSVQQAAAIVKTAEPELVKAVEDGALSLNTAKQIAKADPEVQREIAANADPKKAAKEVLSNNAVNAGSYDSAAFNKDVQDGQYNGRKFLNGVKELDKFHDKFCNAFEMIPQVFDALVGLISTEEEESSLVYTVNKMRNAAETLAEACIKTRSEIAAKTAPPAE